MKIIEKILSVIDSLRQAAHAANLARNGHYDRAQSFYK